MFRRAAPIAAILLAGCTSNVSVTYRPTVPIHRTGPPRLVAVTFADDRDAVEDAYLLGTIRGGFGNAFKTVEGDEPVIEAIGDVFTEAAAARGLIGGDIAPLVLTVVLRTWSADQYLRRRATIDVVVLLRRRAGGAILNADHVRVALDDGSLLSPRVGVFGSTAALAALIRRTIDEAADQALDSPTLRRILAHTPQPRPVVVPPPPPPPDPYAG